MSSSGLIDLRSDTVTRPDDAMRKAMAAAEVGDDVFEEDPTVRRLEERGAEIIGKDASLFMPSGTMGNQVALHLHAKPGTEVICESSSHILLYEMAAMASLSGLLPATIASDRGILLPEEIERAIAPDVTYRARTGLITVENTANMAGGTVYRPEEVRAIVALADRHSLPVHLDGARIFNAALTCGVEPSDLADGCDSVMFCLSKGLGAPVGSLLCGSASFIHEARRVRKMFGGGMRQVGVLAAAGIVALDHGPSNLAKDHSHAALLATELSAMDGIELDPKSVETNIIIFRLRGGRWQVTGEESPAQAFLRGLQSSGVLGVPVGRDLVRFVTHRDVDRDSIEAAIERIRAL